MAESEHTAENDATRNAQAVATHYQRQAKRMAAVLLDVRGYVGADDPNLTARIDEALGGFLADDTRPIPPADGGTDE